MTPPTLLLLLLLLSTLSLSLAQQNRPAPPTLNILAVGDDNLLGNGVFSVNNKTTARYVLKTLLMFDDFVVNYVGPRVDGEGLAHYCFEGEAPIPRDGRDADHIWQGFWERLNFDIALVLTGTHDCYRTGTTFDRIFRSIDTLDRMVTFLRGGPTGKRKVFVAKLPSTMDKQNECAKAYSELIEENFSQEIEGGEPVTVVDLGVDKKEFFDATMYRTNEEGQRQIAGAFYQAIKKWRKEKIAAAKAAAAAAAETNNKQEL